jgi:hypothetical protein
MMFGRRFVLVSSLEVAILCAVVICSGKGLPLAKRYLTQATPAENVIVARPARAAVSASGVTNAPSQANVQFDHLRQAIAGANLVQFSSSNYSVQEDCTTVTITVNRVGDLSGITSVDYNTSDVTATERKDYITALGTLVFAPGETSKSFGVLINEDSYVEGNETFNVKLSNPSGAALGAPATAVVTIIDDPSEPATNPIDDPQNYPCQHYHDFLNRQPDASGLAFWTNEIASCAADAQCIDVKRINVSAAFYLSIEFQQTGYLVERLYKTAFGSAQGASTFGGAHQLAVPVVRLNEFLSDTQKIGQGVVVGQGNWQDILENNKQAFTADFVQRSRFSTAMPASMTAAQFVDTLNTNADHPLSLSEHDQLINDLANNVKNRAQVLRAIAEHPNVMSGEFNRAFVLMQYFGYLRRNPNDQPDTDYTGFDFWLTKLNQFGGNYINSEMIKAFITSLEYRSRFGASGTPTPTPTPTPGPGLTPDQRAAALESVRAKFEDLSNTVTSEDDVNQQLLTFIRSRSEFSAAGISTDSCVWATYTDGVGLTVVNNRKPPVQPASLSHSTESAARRLNARPENLPDSTTAQLIWTLGPAFTDDPTIDLSNWLNEENYNVTISVGAGASVDSLKHVGGNGALFLAGHGGTAENTQAYAVSTAEFQNNAKEQPMVPGSYDDDLKMGRLRYMIATWSYYADGTEHDEKTYGITSKFIRAYWGDFSANAFVFNDACSGASAAASDFQQAIKEKKASVYAGWTNPASSESTARFVFDRLLGGNHVYPESDGYKIRPFDYTSVKQDFQYHGVGKDGTADLVFMPFSDSSTEGFQALAPSIEDMLMDEQTNVLYINGQFGEVPVGEDPGKSRAVSVGGMKADCQFSSPLISCNLPSTGPGSAGEVIVTVRQQKSNTAYLSLWQGTFTHTVLENNTLKEVDTYNLTLRADTRKVRFEIHKPPTFYRFGIESPRIVMATDTSLMGYQCSGTFTAGDCTTIWSGSGTVPRLQTNPLKQGFQVAGGLYDNGRLVLGFSPLSKGRIVDTVCQNSPPSHDNENLFDVVVAPADGGSNPFFSLDASGNITGNKLTFTDGTDAHTFQWSLISIQFPPSPDSPR